MLKNLLTLYRNRFGYWQFYDKLAFHQTAWPDDHSSIPGFLQDYPETMDDTATYQEVLTVSGDVRVDLPVWFGSPAAQHRIMVIGMEPRDTNEHGRYNIERAGNYVFGTPFALERKEGVYHTAFKPLLHAPGLFVYFTDVVKTYDVVQKGNKEGNDLHAREVFEARAKSDAPLLLAEMQLINPTRIIALGHLSDDFLRRHLPIGSPVQMIRHPSYGGAAIAREQLESVLRNLLSAVLPRQAATTVAAETPEDIAPSFRTIRPFNLQPGSYPKQPAIPAIYVWGYQESGRPFVPLYVGKTSNIAERTMQHFCRFRGGEYGVFDKASLDALYYDRQTSIQLQRIYDPTSLGAMITFLGTNNPGHAQMVTHFVLHYIPVQSVADRVNGEKHLADQLNRARLLSFIPGFSTPPAEDIVLEINAMVHALKHKC